MKTNPRTLAFVQFLQQQFPELEHASIKPCKDYYCNEVVVLTKSLPRGSIRARLYLDYIDGKMNGTVQMYRYQTMTWESQVFRPRGMKDLANMLFQRGVIRSKEFKNG